jgi:hypothetical protein
LIFSVAIFALHRAFLSDPDTYWHIATGKWMLTQRAVPRHDIFSYTAVSRPWVNVEWLAQIILFSIYDWFGWRGLVLLCGLVAIAVARAVSHRRMAPAVAASGN